MSVIKSLESTLAEKKAAKYDVGLEERIRQWIATLAEQPVEGEFSLALRDGMVLCQVMNKMCPNLIPRVHNSPLPFKQMENITTFIKCCQMLGLQATELFETPDLYNAADMMRVLQCLDRLMQVHEKYDQETLLARIAEYKSSNVSSPLPATRVASSTTVRPWQKRQAEAQAQAQTQVQQQPGEVPASNFPDRLDSPISVPMASTPSVSSLHEDIATRSEFKYSAELERVAREWMEQILNEDLSKPSFADCLKSGVMLCRLLNTIKPGLVTNKIHLTKIKYHQMENIEHFLQGCQALGVESVNLFNTTDLFEEKAMFLVINSIIVLANNVKSKPWYTGPIIADTSKAKSLWSESLGFTDFSLEEEKEDDDEQEQKPLSPEEQDLVDWFNTQVAKASVPVRPIKNLSTNIRSGVALMRLVEVLTTQKRTAWEAQPKYLWQHMKNATAVLNFIASVTFEQVPNVTARDIVSMRVESIVLLLTYLRDKFDLDFLFQKLLNEDLKDEEKEIHMHVTTAVADQEEVYYEGEDEYYIEGEDGEYYEDDEWYGEDASVVQGEHAGSATSESAEVAEAEAKAEAERRREQEEKVNSEMAAAAAAAAREAKERERAAKQAQTDEEEQTKRQAEEQQIADEQKEKLRVEAVEAEALQKEAEKQKQAQEAEAEKKAESLRLELEQQEAEEEKEKEKEKERLRAELEQQEELEREQERKKKLEEEELENKERERREKEERKKEKEEQRKKKAAAAAAAAEENEQQKRVELEKQSKSSSAETVEPAVPSAVVSTSAEQKEATEEELARKREKRRSKKEKAAKLEKEKSGEHVEEAKKEKREKKVKKEKTGEQAEEAKKEKKARKEKTGESVEEAKGEKSEKKRKSSRRESSRRDMKKKVEKKASSKKSTKDDDKESKDEAAAMGASGETTAAAPAAVVVIVAPNKEGEAAVVEEPKKVKRKGSSKREKKRTSTREKRSEIKRSPEEQKPPSTEEAAVSASSQDSAPATAVVVIAEPAKEEIVATSAETAAAQKLGDGEEAKPQAAPPSPKPLAAVDEPKPAAPAGPAPAELPTTDQPQPQEQQPEAEKPLEDHRPLEEDSPAEPEQGLAPLERRQHEVPEVVVVPATNGVAHVPESPRDSSGVVGAKPRPVLPLRGMARRRGSVIGRGGAVAGAAGVPRVAHPGEQTVEGSQIRTTRIASATSRQEAGAHLPKTEALQDIQAIKMEKARNVVRLRVASEILSTETSYANSLSLVSKHVLSVILKAEGRILTATECQNLFWNWDELCGHHTRFLQLIKERIEKWDISTTIGDIFLHHTDFLSRYRPFLEGYNTSVVTLRHLEKRKPAFKVVKQAFEAEQKKTTFLDLESFLIMPIQRIPRYSLLLRELHKYTNPLHPDYALLEQAATKISKQLSELNAGIDNDQTTCALKLHSIEDSIEGEIVPGETLFNPTRRYVREGVMQLTWKDAKEKQLYFFLFTDLLVCCDKKKGGKKGPGEEFSLLFSLPLGTVLKLDESQLEKKGKLTLVVSEEKGKDKLNCGLTIKDKREKALWAADLKTCVEDAKKPAATKS